MSRSSKLAAALALAVGAVLSTPGVLLAQDHAGGHAPAAAQHDPAAGHAPAAAHDDHAHDAQPSLFAGNMANVVFTLLIFGLVLAVLGKFAWKPLVGALDERERTIREALEAARRQKQESEALLRRYEESINNARVESAAILDEARRDAEVARRRMTEETKKETDEMLARARREIQLATDGAVKELYDRTADLAVQIAGSVVSKSLSADDHRAMVRESLDRMSGAHRGAARNN